MAGSADSTKLLKIDAALKMHMADIQVGKAVDENMATIPFTPAHKAYTDGQNAVDIITKAAPQSPELPVIIELTHQLGEMLEKLPKVDDTLIVSAVLASLTIELINHLANQVHNVAMFLVGATKQIYTCNVKKVHPEEALAVAEYCSGALKSLTNALVTIPELSKTEIEKAKKLVKNEVEEGKPLITIAALVADSYGFMLTPAIENWVKAVAEDKPVPKLPNPTVIHHKLGIHRTKISPKSVNGDADILIDYIESGPQYPGMPGRQEGVSKRLTKEGFTCNVGTGTNIPFGKDLHLHCHGEVDKEKLRPLATFFSLLFNADVAHMGKETSDVVAEKAWQAALKLNQQYGENTWQAPQGQLNWEQLKQEWLQEKDAYQLGPLYENLKKLAKHRDIHHEIEEEVGIPKGKAQKEAVTKIIVNAKDALGILKSNKWATHGMETYIPQLEKMVATGSYGGVAGVSDMVGHTLHDALNGVLHNMKTYGGCDTTGNIVNTNAGTLAYCEGVLQGTSAKPEGGEDLTHKLLPVTNITVIKDEDPEGGYNLHIVLPGTDPWSQSLKIYLPKHFGFDCIKSKPWLSYKAGDFCHLYTNDFDQIRRLALFFSNLRGASNAIGGECIPKAMEAALVSAKTQAEKGMFAFTQEPVITNAKQWIDMCHKQYGILPPGLTKEEKELLAIIGSDKLYAGCDFSNVDMVPNKGVMAYCEGVRKNPQSERNATLLPSGDLQLVFHAEPADPIADINITPTEPGKYEAHLKNMQFYKGGPIVTAVVNKLKEKGWNCPGGASCTNEVNETQLRKLAYFLSSLHQAYNVEPKCMPAIMEYVDSLATTAPNDITAHDEMAYPWVASDWNKEVCSKEGVPIPTKKKVIDEEVPVEEGWQPGLKAPFKTGGCTSLTSIKPTKLKKAYCSGVAGKVMIDDEAVDFKLPGLLPGTAASLGTKENIHYLGVQSPVIFDSKWSSIHITLPKNIAEIKPLVDTLKSPPLLMKTTDGKTFIRDGVHPYGAARVARFLSYCSGIENLPEWCHEAAVKYAENKAKTFPTEPIYPFKTADWESEVCEAVSPVKEKKAVPMLYSELFTTAKTLVQATMLGLIKEGKNKYEGIQEVMDLHNLELAGLSLLWVELKAKEGKAPEEAKPTLTPQELKNHILSAISHAPEKKTDFETLKNVIQTYYDVPTGPAGTEGTISWAMNQLIAEKKLVHITGITYGIPEEAKPSLDALIVQSEKKMAEASANIAMTEWSKVEEIKEYKKLPKKFKDYFHAWANLKLLEGHKEGSTYDEILATLQKSWSKELGGPLSITPLMVKLQLDIEKKKKIRRGELPPEDGEAVAKTYEEMEDWEKNELYDSLVEKGMDEPNYDVLESLAKEQYGIDYSHSLEKVIYQALAQPKGEEKQGTPPKAIASLKNEMHQCYKSGFTKEQCVSMILNKFAWPTPDESESLLETIWDEMVPKWDKETGKKFFTVHGGDSPSADIDKLGEFSTLEEAIDFATTYEKVPFSYIWDWGIQEKVWMKSWEKVHKPFTVHAGESGAVAHKVGEFAALDGAIAFAEEWPLPYAYVWNLALKQKMWQKGEQGLGADAEPGIDAEIALNTPWVYYTEGETQGETLDKVKPYIPNSIASCFAKKIGYHAGPHAYPIFLEGWPGLVAPEKAKELWAECINEYLEKKTSLSVDETKEAILHLAKYQTQYSKLQDAIEEMKLIHVPVPQIHGAVIALEEEGKVVVEKGWVILKEDWGGEKNWYDLGIFPEILSYVDEQIEKGHGDALLYAAVLEKYNVEPNPDLEKLIETKFNEYLAKKKQGEKELTPWWNLAFDTKISVGETVVELLKQGKLPSEIIPLIAKYDVLLDELDIKEINEKLLQAKAIQVAGEIWYKWINPETQKLVQEEIKSKAADGKDESAILSEIMEEFSLAHSYDWSTGIGKAIKEQKEEKGIPPIPAVMYAINVIKGGTPYCGCTPDKPGYEITAPMVKYCEGIMSPPNKPKAGFIQMPTDELNALFTAAGMLTATDTPTIVHYGNGYGIYSPSAGHNSLDLIIHDKVKSDNWETRRKSVMNLMESKLGFQCGLFDEDIMCSTAVTHHMTKEDGRRLRTTAAFLSTLHDVDKLDSACIPTAVHLAYENAKLVEKQHKTRLHRILPYPYGLDQWEKKVCNQ